MTLSNRTLFSIMLVLSSVSVAQAQRLPATLFGGGSQTCNYQYAIPKGGNCDTYMGGLEDRLKTSQQDLQIIKNQFNTHNAQLLQTLRQLRQQTSTAQTDLADVTKDFRDLQGTVFLLQAKINNNNNKKNNNNINIHYNGGSNGSGNPSPSDVMLQQLVNSTRQQLTQTMTSLRQDLNSVVAAVKRERQTDAIQQSTVDSAFQDELRQQQQDLSTVLQRLQQLQQRVTNLRPLTTHNHPSPNTPASPALSITPAPAAPPTSQTAGTGLGVTIATGPVLQQLQSDVQRVAARVTQLAASYVTDVPDLLRDVKDIQEAMQQSAISLSDTRTAMDYLQSNKLPDLEQQQQINYGAIAQLSNTIRTDFRPLQTQVQAVASNVSSLVTQINRLGTDILSQVSQQRQDETQLADLSLEVRLLASKLTNLIRNQHFTTPIPPSTRAPTTATFAVPTPKH